MRATTWATICRTTLVVMPLAMGSYFFAPEVYWLNVASSVAIFAVIWVAFIGARMGIAVARGKLELRCPECDKDAKVLGRDKRELYLDCQNCGVVKVAMRGIRNRWTIVEEPDDLESES